MKFISPIFAKASGSLGGTTYSHNKGGMYVRNRSTPINPATPQQQAIRNAMKTLVTRWSNILTPVQRDAWKTYAVNVPIINKLGESRIIPELAMYLRCNSPRLTNEGHTEIVDNAPTIFALATFLPVSATMTSPNIALNFNNTDDWAITDSGFMYLYQSRPQNPSINFWKGPYQYAGHVAGNTMTPPTAPHNIPSVFPIISGSRYFFRVNVTNADGRLSSSQTFVVDQP